MLKDYIIFESINEKGELKADLIARSHVGSTWVTRRKIDEDDICAVCKNKKSVCEKAGKTSSHLFFPAKYAIGRKLKITKQPANGVYEQVYLSLCECGCLNEFHRKAYSCSSCRSCLCSKFTPILLEITGGMWHKDWAEKTRIENAKTDRPLLARAFSLQEEAQKEGFCTWQGMLKAFEENKKKWGDIEKSWRVELKRIQ